MIEAIGQSDGSQQVGRPFIAVPFTAEIQRHGDIFTGRECGNEVE